MAKLDQNRLQDSTSVNKVDDQHNKTEEDIEEIFGIPDNTPITAYIFGQNPQNPGAKPVQPDGSIRGVPILKSAGVQADPSTAVGFKFDDGAVKKLLVFVSSELKIYKDSDYPNENWELVASVETPGTGKLTTLSDWEGPDDISGETGKLVKCTGTGFDLQDPSAGTGVTTFAELTDGPGDYGNAGDLLYSSGNDVVWGAAPSVSAPLILFADTTSTDGWGNPGNWLNSYGWTLRDPEGSGFVSTDQSTYLGSAGSIGNIYWKNLPAGPYEVSVFYSTTDGAERIKGTRQWKVSGTDLYGPAVEGVAHRATVGFQDETGAPVAAIDGAKYLGTKLLIVGSTTTDMVIKVLQNSGDKIGSSSELTFYAVIRRIQ